jgi:L-fuculose-phosphate aldolase
MSAIDKLGEEVSRFSRLSYERFLVRASGGNISVRLPNDGGFLVTPSGISLRDITPDLLLVVDEAGQRVSGPSHLRPSKETQLHLCVYRHQPLVNAVVHVHPPYTTAFTVKPDGIPMITPQSRLKVGCFVPIAKYAAPGSVDLVKNIEECLVDCDPKMKAILMADHGVLTFDTHLSLAFDTAELIEETACIALAVNILERM